MHPTKQIAENHISISPALFREGMGAVESGSYQKAVHKLIFVLVGIYLAVALWLLCTGGSLFYLAGESVFLGALLYWLLVMLPGARCRSKYKALAQGNAGIPERTVKFYEDHLTVLTNAGKETTIPYSSVQSWKETRNLYILNCGRHTHVLLHKTGFVMGDFQAVSRSLSLSSLTFRK